MRIILLGMAILSALGAPSFANTVIAASIKKEFADVCLKAYLVSSPKGAAMGKQICDCTARESTLQGVLAKNLQRETAKIRQNPKYQIQDKALLNAMRACFIDSYADEVKQENAAKNPPRKKKVKLAAHPSPRPSPPSLLRPLAQPSGVAPR
jgi:hypothetical protein